MKTYSKLARCGNATASHVALIQLQDGCDLPTAQARAEADGSIEILTRLGCVASNELFGEIEVSRFEFSGEAAEVFFTMKSVTGLAQFYGEFAMTRAHHDYIVALADPCGSIRLRRLIAEAMCENVDCFTILGLDPVRFLPSL